MVLEANGKVISQNPDGNLIRETLAALDINCDGEGFAILSCDPMTYVQVGGDRTTGFDAEYQEGHVAKHYRADARLSLDEAAQLMTEYLAGHVAWEKYGQWSKISW